MFFATHFLLLLVELERSCHSPAPGHPKPAKFETTQHRLSEPGVISLSPQLVDESPKRRAVYQGDMPLAPLDKPERSAGPEGADPGLATVAMDTLPDTDHWRQ
jgi:hypothetical protein